MITKQATSAGGVIFRKTKGRVEVALISHADGKIWALPKGTVEENEDLEKTALREVEEETGLKGKIIDKIGLIDYWFYWKADDTRYHKFVHFFLLEFQGGSVERHDHEAETVIWSPIDEALSRMTYKSELDILEKAEHMIEDRAVIG